MKKDCIHHWHLDSKNEGTCQKCGAVKDFRAPQLHDDRAHIWLRESTHFGKPHKQVIRKRGKEVIAHANIPAGPKL